MFRKKTTRIITIIYLFFFVLRVSSAQDQIPQTWSESTHLDDSKWEKIPDHPRLFTNSKRWDDLKKQVKNDSVSKKVFEIIKERAEITLKSKSLISPGVGVFHGEARQIQGRIAVLAITYKLTGDKRFLERARKEMTDLANAANWRPDHFLSCSESTVAMSIGLDWLYNDLSVTDRRLFADAIIEKALKTSLLKKYNLSDWLPLTNW